MQRRWGLGCALNDRYGFNWPRAERPGFVMQAEPRKHRRGKAWGDGERGQKKTGTECTKEESDRHASENLGQNRKVGRCCVKTVRRKREALGSAVVVTAAGVIITSVSDVRPVMRRTTSPTVRMHEREGVLSEETTSKAIVTIQLRGYESSLSGSQIRKKRAEVENSYR